jgi:uncharacterized protein (TIGR00297 family)
MTIELNPLAQLLLGVGLAVAISLAAWRAGALTSSGAWAAVLMGSVIFGLGGLRWAALLLTFFITSSGLSRLFKERKRAVNEKYAKGSRRDWAQVLANGGLAMFIIGPHLLYPAADWPWLAFAGALATANADTWATELGILSPRGPRLITNGTRVPKGTSGGISLVGTLATTAGAALVGLVAWAFSPDSPGWPLLAAITLAGVAGSLVDSMLGATVQAIYYDPVRQKETEKVVINADGTPAEPVRGQVWINNDMVNFTASACGALTAAGIWNLLH